MKKGGNRKNSMVLGSFAKQNSGFTIVEVLIVLAVTGLLFLSAVIFINGRQNRTEFTVSINSMQQQIQQVMNETASGYYPNQNFSCTAGLAGQPIINAGSQSQGTKIGCVFLGKVIQFAAADSDNTTAGIVYPMVGNQNAQSILTAAPITLVTGGSTPIDLSVGLSSKGGLTVQSMYYNGNPANTTAGIGFLAGGGDGTFASSSPDGVGLASGSLQFSLYAVKATAVNSTTKSAMVAALDALKPAAPPVEPVNLVAVSQVSVCFASGTTNQSGLITIGQGNSQAVSLQIKGNTTCS
jgi:prepilin-type N-terminal cleavage/methylation domain-containing protein